MESCEAIGMDRTVLSPCHLDLGPRNILLDVDTKKMSVIDFETVGYVPDEWTRTKFRACGGLDLNCYGFDDEGTGGRVSKNT
jgi:hypothetical protein